MFVSLDATNERILEDLNSEFYRSFESLDMGRMSEVWLQTNESLCVHPGWDLVKGWPAIQKSWEIIFGSTRYMEFDIQPLSLLMRGSWAQVVCYENLLTASEGPAQRARVLSTNAFCLDPSGKWRLFHHHASQIEVRPPFAVET